MGIRRSVRRIKNFFHRVVKWNSMMLWSGWCVYHSDALRLDLLLNRKSFIDYQIWKNGVYDPYLIRALAKIVHSKDVGFFFDIGANIGQMSCFVKKANPRVDVIAFEPVWRNFIHIEMNKIINDLEFTAECLALSDNVGELTLYMPNTSMLEKHGEKINMGMPSIMLDECMDEENKILVSSDTFDRYVEKMEIESSIGCIFKIDVEGSEKNVIHGMKKFLRSHEEIYIIVELNISRNKDVKDIVDFLCGNGFVMYDMLLEPIELGGLTIKDGNYVFAKPNSFPETLNAFPRTVTAASSLKFHS